MRLEKKVTDYTLKFCYRELKVVMECLKGAKLKDCREQCLAWDLLDEFKELLGENKDNEDDEEEFLEKSYMESIVNQDDCVNSEVNYRQQMIDSIFRKPSEESIES